MRKLNVTTKDFLRLFICLPGLGAMIQTHSLAQNTLRLSPANPHYFLYQNKPVILITSAEHYGALINPDFNYTSYLDALKKQNMNNTRVFSGAYVERENDIKWMLYSNTLAPRPSKLLTPWQRSTTAGYINGGNKFDLDKWDDKYFAALKNLVQQAASREIMAELTLFGNQYNDSTYGFSPLHPDNNIQNVGKKGTKSFLIFQSLEDTALVARQDAMVVKIVREMNDFDNLYYEISNEPYNDVKDSSVVERWHVHIADLIRKTEKLLPKKHLIAANQSIVDYREIDIANYHYVHISNIPRFDSLLHLHKVIGMDETMGSLRDADVNDVRVEAWDFILHGGGLYNNLSWEYTPEKPQGTAGADTIRQYLQNLQKFMQTFDFIKMNYAAPTLVAPPPKTIVRVLEEKGSQYAVYIFHGKPFTIDPKDNDFISKYEAEDQVFHDTLTLLLPTGNYTMQWYHPAEGKWIGKPAIITHKGGNYTCAPPAYRTDIALKITKDK